MAYCKECHAIFPSISDMKECPYCGALNFRRTRKRYVALDEVTEYPFTNDADTDAMIKDAITEIIGGIETELTLEDAYEICWNILRNTLAMCIASDDYLEAGM